MNNRNTIYVFLALVAVSWFIELWGGWWIVHWYLNTAWLSYSYPGAQALAPSIASLGHWTTYNPDGTVRRAIDFHWTAQGVTIFVYVVIYLGLHVYNIILNGMLRPFLRRWKLGARAPIGREKKQFDTAFQAISSSATEPVSRPRRWLVADGGGLDMRWHGYWLIIDRELLSNRYFTALLAPQIGHANSEDRLAHRIYEMLPPPALVCMTMVGLPVGLGHAVTFPFWMWYWRQRVYAADAFAVEVNQGNPLVQALDRLYLRADQATRGGRLLKPIPYIAQRIDRIERRLRQYMPGGGRII